MKRKVAMMLTRPDGSKLLIYEPDLKWINDYYGRRRCYTPHQKQRLRLVREFMQVGRQDG